MVDWSQILQGCWLRNCKIVQSTQISILIDEITLLLKEQVLLKQLNTCMQKNSGSSKYLEENCMIWRYIYSKKIKNSKFFRWSSSKRCFLLLKLKTKLKLSNQILKVLVSSNIVKDIQIRYVHFLALNSEELINQNYSNISGLENRNVDCCNSSQCRNILLGLGNF